MISGIRRLLSDVSIPGIYLFPWILPTVKCKCVEEGYALSTRPAIRKIQSLLLSCLLVPPQDYIPSLCLGYFQKGKACSWHNSKSCFVLVF